MLQKSKSGREHQFEVGSFSHYLQGFIHVYGFLDLFLLGDFLWILPWDSSPSIHHLVDFFQASNKQVQV